MDADGATRPLERHGDELLKSVFKAVSVLDCFSTLDVTLSISEIAERTGMPRGTTHRVMATLREAGLVEQERQRERYRLGMKLFELGNIVLANMELHREAKSFIEALAKVSGEAVHLCVFDGMQSTLIKRTEPTREHTNTIVVMEASPAYCTATGKAALAYQTDAVVDRVIALGLKPFTEHTITDAAALKRELATIRARGYSTDDEELTLGIRCVGAPIRNLAGRVFASVSVSGAAKRFPAAKIPQLGQLVGQYAEAISAQLGYRKTDGES